MLEGILSSLVVKVLAAVTGIAAVAGGLAAVGALPGLDGGGTAAADASVSTEGGNASVSAASAFPVDLSSLPVGSEAAEAFALSTQAQESAAAAAAAATKCLDDADIQISSLAAAISGIATTQQAQNLVAKAGTIGSDAQKCAEQAKALSETARAQAAAAAKASGLSGLPGLGGLSGLPDPQGALARILAASQTAGEAAAAAEALALGIVNRVITTVGGLLPVPVDGLPLPGQGGALPVPVPGTGEGGLPLPGVGQLPGLPLPGGAGGLPVPVPGGGGDGLPVPGVGGVGGPTQLVSDLTESLLGALGGRLPVPAL